MFLLQGVAALAAKVASASTVAQAATGLGIAVVGVTGAGAVGVLPGSVQDGVAGAIEAVTPFDVPDSTGAGETEDSGLDGPDDGPGADPTDIPPATPTATPTGTGEPGDDHGGHRGSTPTTTSSAAAVRTDDSGPGSVNSGRDAQGTSGRDHPEDDGLSSAPTSSAASDSADDDTDDSDEDSSGRRSGDGSSGSGGRDDDSDD